MKSKITGDTSEAVVITELLKLGYRPHLPWGDNERHDLLVKVENEWVKVQVKTLYEDEREGRLVANLSTTNSHNGEKKYYTEDEVDAFALYSREGDEVYWMWFEEAPKKKVTIAVDYKQKQKTMNIAGNYTISEKLK